MILTYKTISVTSSGEFKDRGSKFLGYAYPINSPDDVKKILQDLRKEHPKAVHHCFAYRIGTDGLQYRANDDGEPSGSAGRPILGQIDSAGLTNLIVVVVRYFGGTLLGVPGLINAYKTTTALCLENAVVIEKNMEYRIMLDFDYSVMNEVMYVLKQHEATIYRNDMQLFCQIEAGIPLQQKAACLSRLEEIRGATLKPL